MPIAPDPAWVGELKAALPELPRVHRAPARRAEWGLSDLDMQSVVNAGAVELIEETVAAGASPAGARKWWLGELARRANETGVELAARRRHARPQVAELQRLVDAGKLNDKLARAVLEGVVAGEGDPAEVMAARGLGGRLRHRRADGRRRRGDRRQPGRRRRRSATARSPRPARWSARS